MNSNDKYINYGDIILPNRYDYKSILRPVTYSFTTDAQYVSVHGDGKNILAIDPEGGPYMAIGYEISEGVRIKNIRSNGKEYLIDVENIEEKTDEH